MKIMKIEGECLRFNEVNLNGIVYTKDSIKNLDEFIEKINDGKCLGELGFYDRFEISLQNVSHRIESLKINDNGICVTAKVLDTPKGNIIKRMLKYHSIRNKIKYWFKILFKKRKEKKYNIFNDTFSFALRGTGTIDASGNIKNFNLYSIDIIPKNLSSWKENFPKVISHK